MKKLLRFFIATAVTVLLLVGNLLPTYAAVRVNGYYKKNGTYVQPYYRSNPNSTKLDNYSTKGNINPYTGKIGTKNPTPTTSYIIPPNNTVAPANKQIQVVNGSRIQTFADGSQLNLDTNEVIRGSSLQPVVNTPSPSSNINPNIATPITPTATTATILPNLNWRNTIFTTLDSVINKFLNFKQQITSEINRVTQISSSVTTNDRLSSLFLQLSTTRTTRLSSQVASIDQLNIAYQAIKNSWSVMDQLTLNKIVSDANNTISNGQVSLQNDINQYNNTYNQYISDESASQQILAKLNALQTQISAKQVEYDKCTTEGTLMPFVIGCQNQVRSQLSQLISQYNSWIAIYNN